MASSPGSSFGAEQAACPRVRIPKPLSPGCISNGLQPLTSPGPLSAPSRGGSCPYQLEFGQGSWSRGQGEPHRAASPPATDCSVPTGERSRRGRERVWEGDLGLLGATWGRALGFSAAGGARRHRARCSHLPVPGAGGTRSPTRGCPLWGMPPRPHWFNTSKSEGKRRFLSSVAASCRGQLVSLPPFNAFHRCHSQPSSRGGVSTGLCCSRLHLRRDSSPSGCRDVPAAGTGRGFIHRDTSHRSGKPEVWFPTSILCQTGSTGKGLYIAQRAKKGRFRPKSSETRRHNPRFEAR